MTNLFNDYAIEQFIWSLLFGRPDMDLKLEEVGISRTDLRKLEYDDEIAGAIETRSEAIISTPWRIEPATSRNQKFIWNEIEPHLENLMRAAWNAVLYGYSVPEVVYRKLPDGKIGIEHIIEKPFEWFVPEFDGTLHYVHPEEGRVVVDTTFKFLLTVRRPSYRNPRGEALFSRLYSAWFLRTHGWRFWIKFLERVGIPFLVGTTEGDVEDMLARLKAAVNGSTIAVGGGEKVEFLTAGNGAPFEAFDDRLSRRIQKLVLGQTGTTDVSNSGSYAAAKVHDGVREDRRNADLRLVRKTCQKLLNALWVLNKFPGDVPTFCLEDDTGLQVERADRDSKLITSGIVRKFSEDYILRAYDFERGDIESGEGSPSPVDQNDPQNGSQEGGTPKENTEAGEEDGPSFSAGRFTPQQEAIEALAGEAARLRRQPIDPDAIRGAIRGARDPEDLEARLAVVLQGVSYNEFTRQLERALYAADVMGYVHPSGD